MRQAAKLAAPPMLWGNATSVATTASCREISASGVLLRIKEHLFLCLGESPCWSTGYAWICKSNIGGQHGLGLEYWGQTGIRLCYSLLLPKPPLPSTYPPFSPPHCYPVLRSPGSIPLTPASLYPLPVPSSANECPSSIGMQSWPLATWSSGQAAHSNIMPFVISRSLLI